MSRLALAGAEQAEVAAGAPALEQPIYPAVTRSASVIDTPLFGVRRLGRLSECQAYGGLGVPPVE